MSALYGTYARSDLAFERGEGVRLFAQDGTEYLDFHGGIAVNALGHADPHMVAALKSAAEKVWHVANTFTIPEQERLGQRLVEATFADACFFTNSGTEAVECAIKTARHYFWAKGRKIATRSSPSPARSTAGPWAWSPRLATPTISRASARRSPASSMSHRAI
jgi:acetylornithine/N-succinyldiaminopimelate aminotransferase